jgi:hypothetical protein
MGDPQRVRDARFVRWVGDEPAKERVDVIK